MAAAQSDVGDVAFANSGAPAAQQPFLRGLALLHNFEYESAAASFREAQKIDPDFAMAYWGEAMTSTHPIWFQQDLNAARAVLQRAPKAKTDRERAYMLTMEVLYGEGTKEERDFKYADAMRALHERYPDDVDATAFYALSLLGTSHHGRDTATYMRSAALLEEVFPAHQHHPGVLHYLIHSYDDPVHAPLGMRAARLYGAVAPNAGHALHMTSHIFVAMGMWDDVIEANRRAIAVVNEQRAAKSGDPAACGHYPTWMHYALLQKRQFDEARRMLDACRASAFSATYKSTSPMDSDEWRISAYAAMVSNQVASGGALASADTSVSAEKSAAAKFSLVYAEALAAAQRGDAAALKDAGSRLRGLQKEPAKLVEHRHSTNPNYEQRIAIVLQQVDALQWIAAGKRGEAVAILRKAADAEDAMPFEFGPPFVEKPSRELLGDTLLAMSRTAEAAQAYRAALARTPGRTLAAEGLERAERR